MKTLLTVILLTTSFLIKAQTTGATFKVDMETSTKSKFLVSMGFGYAYKNILVEGQVTAPPLDLRADVPAYFGANAGYIIEAGNWKITPLAGTNYRMQSTDKRKLNGFVTSLGARLQFKDIYLGVAHSDKTTFFSLGIFGIIGE